MAHRLDPTGTPRVEVMIAATDQLTDAISALRAIGGRTDVGEHVHGARKSLRRFRSTLRLVRPALGTDAYARAATPTRDLGRRLSVPRDADVMAKTVRSLIDESSGEPSRDAIAEELAARWEVERDAVVADGWFATVAPTTLVAVHDEIGDWKLGGLEWMSLLEGVVRSYRRGRDAFEVARRRGTPEAVHEARKRTKDLRYQLELLRDLWEPMIAGQATGARELTDTIGTLRDLVLLRGILADGDLDPLGVVALTGEIDVRMATLHDRAMEIGSRLYAEKPAAMERRMLAYEPRGGVLVS
jgi:CHAD domain-containing protein